MSKSIFLTRTHSSGWSPTPEHVRNWRKGNWERSPNSRLPCPKLGRPAVLQTAVGEEKEKETFVTQNWVSGGRPAVVQ